MAHHACWELEHLSGGEDSSIKCTHGVNVGDVFFQVKILL